MFQFSFSCFGTCRKAHLIISLLNIEPVVTNFLLHEDYGMGKPVYSLEIVLKHIPNLCFCKHSVAKLIHT